MKHFPSERKQNLKSFFFRKLFNLFPAYRGTGARIIFISDDTKEIQIKIPKNWRTRNYVGTIFGGSMYAGCDPIFMLQLIHILGENYVVWDKAASIRFKKPGKDTLYAKFEITDLLIQEIKNKVKQFNKVDIPLTLELKDKNNIVHAEVDKVLYIADKSFYKSKSKLLKPSKS